VASLSAGRPRLSCPPGIVAHICVEPNRSLIRLWPACWARSRGSRRSRQCPPTSRSGQGGDICSAPSGEHAAPRPSACDRASVAAVTGCHAARVGSQSKSVARDPELVQTTARSGSESRSRRSGTSPACGPGPCQLSGRPSGGRPAPFLLPASGLVQGGQDRGRQPAPCVLRTAAAAQDQAGRPQTRHIPPARRRQAAGRRVRPGQAAMSREPVGLSSTERNRERSPPAGASAQPSRRHAGHGGQAAGRDPERPRATPTWHAAAAQASAWALPPRQQLARRGSDCQNSGQASGAAAAGHRRLGSPPRAATVPAGFCWVPWEGRTAEGLAGTAALPPTVPA
jgi:hypothetical protein